MFATARKYLLLPSMLGFTAVVSAMGPAIAAPLAPIETTDTVSVNCVQPELEATGFCVPLPPIPVNPAMIRVEAVSTESEMIEPEMIESEMIEWKLQS